MKKIILSLLVLVCATGAFARGPQNGQPGAQGHRHQSGPRGERPQF